MADESKVDVFWSPGNSWATRDYDWTPEMQAQVSANLTRLHSRSPNEGIGSLHDRPGVGIVGPIIPIGPDSGSKT